MFVYILFTCAFAVPALSKASALTGEVKTPSNRCAEDTIRSPLRPVHCRENRKKQQSKMLNLCLNRLSCSTVRATVQWRLWWQMSESRRRPVIAPDAVLGGLFCTAGRGVKVIIAENHSISHTQIRAKIMHESKLRHASMPVSSLNASTAMETTVVGSNGWINQVNEQATRYGSWGDRNPTAKAIDIP